MTESPGNRFRSPNRSHERRYFYKYVSAAIAKLILKSRTLRWSSPIRFNDPFDTTQEVPLAFAPALLNALLIEEWVSLVEQGNAGSVSRPILAMPGRRLDSASSNERKRFIRDFHRAAPSTTREQIDAFDALKEHWRNVVPRLRVLCLSELNDVTPMWFHYADRYKGAVLEFESIDELDSCFLVARPVIYHDPPPAIAEARKWVRCLLGQSQKTTLDLFKEYQYTKTISWAYEREWRIVRVAGSGDTAQFADYPFRPLELSRFYFGSDCSEADQKAILSLLSNGLEHVSCYQAVAGAADGRFTFRPHHRSASHPSQ